MTAQILLRLNSDEAQLHSRIRVQLVFVPVLWNLVLLYEVVKTTQNKAFVCWGVGRFVRDIMTKEVRMDWEVKQLQWPTVTQKVRQGLFSVASRCKSVTASTEEIVFVCLLSLSLTLWDLVFFYIFVDLSENNSWILKPISMRIWCQSNKKSRSSEFKCSFIRKLLINRKPRLTTANLELKTCLYSTYINIIWRVDCFQAAALL